VQAGTPLDVERWTYLHCIAGGDEAPQVLERYRPPGAEPDCDSVRARGHTMAEMRTPDRSWLTPRRAIYLLAGILSLSFGYDLMRIPVQVSDTLVDLIYVQQSPSGWESFMSEVTTSAYLRPLRLAQVKVLFDLAHGHYWLVYRGSHVLLLAAALFLFVRALDIRTWRDGAAGAFALTVFTGIHTFRGIVREGFPVNHFLVIVV
jgi:hypothetical protein